MLCSMPGVSFPIIAVPGLLFLIALRTLRILSYNF